MTTSRQRIRKAVFPVAGLGTRFLPATKAMPKEMLTVVDRPVIQHVVDEARAAGIVHFVFVTGRNKGVIEDHFDRQYELEETLAKRKKTKELEVLRAEVPGPGTASFTRQQEPLGLGHAVWCARELVGNEPFALLLPDVVVQSPGKSCLAQMMEAYTPGSNIIAVEEVPPAETSKYGVVSIGAAEKEGKVWPVTGMVEKPLQGTAPSNLIIMGRYILQPEIFAVLASQEKGQGGEIQLTDGMKTLMDRDRQPFKAVRYEGRSYDCGNKVGFLLANLAFGLANAEIGPELRREMKNLA